MMEHYIEKGGKRLRLGYTTGSCAAAAAKAAAWTLLTGRTKERIQLTTPKGMELDLPVKTISVSDRAVTCAIQKDSGDDPDVTNGLLIYATVQFGDRPGITIDGGAGIGRVTKPGLDQPVGNAAINSVPRRMITENLEEVIALTDHSGGLHVEISAPGGEEIGKRTFNPRLGIVGGISILGTTGIVEPMSEKALVDTIRVELKQRRENGHRYVLLTPGNYGSDYVRQNLHLDMDLAVQISNFLGDSLDICRELGFQGVLLVGHIGKLVKVAGGMMNTHSKYGDCRMEILAAHAGAQGASASVLQKILSCVACDDALKILQESGGYGPAMESLTKKVAFHLQYRAGEQMQTGTILYSKEYGLLGQTPNAQELIQNIMEE